MFNGLSGEEITCTFGEGAQDHEVVVRFNPLNLGWLRAELNVCFIQHNQHWKGQDGAHLWHECQRRWLECNRNVLLACLQSCCQHLNCNELQAQAAIGTSK